MARNPFQPGVGTTPPYLADRDEELQRFHGYLRDFPDKRRNVRLSGLRGVGQEQDFAVAIADDLETAIRAFSGVAKLKAVLSAARRAVGEITVGLPGGASVSIKPDAANSSSVLEDGVAKALIHVGRLAAKADRGVAFLYLPIGCRGRVPTTRSALQA